MEARYKVFFLVVLIILALIFLKRRNTMEVSGYKKIGPGKAKEMMDSGEDLIILDVRTQGEYDQGHIGGSLLIDVQDLDQEAEKKLRDKDQTILVYCRSGNRSAKAARILVDKGYKKVYDFGGIMDWPYEIVR